MSNIKRTIRKSFRLLDVNTYDYKDDDENSSENSDDSGKNPFHIQLFGLNEKGETASIIITDYQPFFYVKVGDNWTSLIARKLFDSIKKRIGKLADSIISVKLVDHNKLYGFSGGKQFRFACFTFANIATFNRVKNLWYQYDPNSNQRKSKPFIFDGITLELYESNIPPLLRFFHIQSISPSGWIFVQTTRCQIPPIKTTTCIYEYICSLKNIKSAPEKETPVPYKICSFDIEASSSHGDFPLPKKTYKRFVTQLIDTFQHQLTVLTSEIQQKKFITKAIMASFGYERMDNIDRIYTIDNTIKSDIQNRIKTLLETDIPTEMPIIETIETLFERMSSISERCNNEEAEGDEENEEEEKSNKSNKSIQKYKTKSKTTIFIYDLLSKTDISREQKILITNKLMVEIFQKVEGDKVTFIGSTFMTYGSKSPYLNHCVVLNTCDSVPGVEIQSVETEKDVLLEWAKLIRRENPDIIIGYNIFGFDYEYMLQRAKENNCESSFLELSRCQGHISGKHTNGEWMLDKTQIKIASGEYDLRYPVMTGRLQIDLYAYFRRDFNLSSYKLDDVAGQYISDEIKFSQIDINQNTQLYSKNLAGLNVGDFIHIKINSFSSDYFNDGQKFNVLSIESGVSYKEKKYNVITIKGAYDIPEPSGSVVSIDWGMAKDDVSPQDIFRLTDGSASDRAIVAKYCIQDCNLVHHLMSKLDVLTGYIEMSSICSVPISFLVFRGQGVKLTSYVAKKCREKNTLMPDLEKSGGNEGYEGAIVLPPKCSMYIDNPVACVDYSSLYPSSMISQNYSHDSKVWSKEYDMSGKLIKVTGEQDLSKNFLYDNLPGYNYINIEFKTYKYLQIHPAAVAKKTQIGTKICRWVQLPHNQKSVMPSILTELLDARSITKKKCETESDPFMKNILDKRQIGYKVTANSLYGQCGAKTSTFYEMDVAASTTATGQMMITYAKRMIEEIYGDSLYDTMKNGSVKCNAEYVYGDSVANYTPITIRVSGYTDILTIEELAIKYGKNRWVMCEEPGKNTKEYCKISNIDSWTEDGWTPLHHIIRHKLAPTKKMFRIASSTGFVDVTDDHSLLTPSGLEISPNDCQIGTLLLHHPPSNLPLKTLNNTVISNGCEYISSNLVYISKIAYIAQNSGFSFYLDKQYDDKYKIKIIKKKRPDETAIIEKFEINYNGDYVYDLTTENHHFQAGPGNIIVHNTDSVFFTFNLTNPDTGEKIRGKPALEITIEIAQEAAKLCSEYLKPPMGLAYEKTLMPFILLSKKRYVGILYENDPNNGYLKFMGLVLKRRDNCDLVKDIYGGVLNHLMTGDIKTAIQFLYDSLENLIQGNVPMDKLTITKALRGEYKNPAAIAHRVLADRIAQRDPGNRPKAGDRIKYLYIVNKFCKLQGDKIETIEFIIANKLNIDYTHYITNQLMKPLQQLFGLAIEQIWELQHKTDAIKTFKKDMVSLTKEMNGDIEGFMKKREKCTSAKIKVLLFDKFLIKIFNQQNGVRTMNDFFVKK